MIRRALLVLGSLVWSPVCLAAPLSLLYSTAANRSTPQDIAGVTVSADIYLYTYPEDGIAQVTYFLDSPEQTDAPWWVERIAPYDFAGGSAAQANPFSTHKLADGPHTITAAIRYTNGTSQTIHRTFTVANAATRFPSQIVWSRTTPSPVRRTEAQVGVLDGKMYVFGGYYNGPVSGKRSDVYDPAANTWTRLPDLPQGTTHGGTTVDPNGRDIYIAGGYIPGTVNGGGGGNQIFAVRNVWKFNIDRQTWSAAPPLPEARGGGALVLLGRELHFFGGSDLRRRDRTEHWVLRLNGGQSWTPAAPFPNPRNHLGGIALGAKIYAVGGQIGQDRKEVLQPTVHVWDPADPSRWTAVKSLPLARSHIAGATFVMNNRIMTIGGEVGYLQSTNVVSAYDPATDTWSPMTPLPEAKNSGVAGVIQGTIYYSTGPTFKGTPVYTTAE
ncbi:Kelch repeat-containing protein [Anthocerotibacter panamensis]|uniref:Kelch repeat-containing protein n=1 Tax=Anthocerotibacter panamensis TaxID=2857077 RepID=UPI001C407DFD|nr:kelch repeat-containing protein [Anthocerotibacter panamensis]